MAFNTISLNVILMLALLSCSHLCNAARPLREEKNSGEGLPEQIPFPPFPFPPIPLPPFPGTSPGFPFPPFPFPFPLPFTPPGVAPPAPVLPIFTPPAPFLPPVLTPPRLGVPSAFSADAPPEVQPTPHFTSPTLAPPVVIPDLQAPASPPQGM